MGTCSSLVNESSSDCKSGKMGYKFENLKHSTNYTVTIAAVNPGGSSQPSRTNFLTDALPDARKYLYAIYLYVVY